MDVRADIVVIETRLRQRGMSVAKLCRAADLSPVTWCRWKQGMQAQKGTWDRVQSALASIEIAVAA
jgi:lambda repressor-like predicted transcriptional regulator